jgi:hypothetical protein
MKYLIKSVLKITVDISILKRSNDLKRSETVKNVHRNDQERWTAFILT